MADCSAPAQGATLDTSGIPAGETVVQGIVSRSGNPAGGNYVRLLDSGGDFTAEVVTSPAGVFRFFAKPGSWTVRVIGPGPGHDEPVSVDAGEVAEVNITL
jgi:hypothetical protein